MRGLLALGALFAIAFVLTRGNANAGLFLFLAVVCLGAAGVSLFARPRPRFGGSIRSRAGRSERDLLVGGLLLISLLTPWTVAVPTLRWPQMFGWESPLALATVGALAFLRTGWWRRYTRLALLVAALGLMAWFAWVSVPLLKPAFRTSGFPFLPIDLMGEGWYIALVAFAVSVDGIAVEASAMDRPVRVGEVWPFAVVPGMGLVRLHYFTRGRLWLIAAGFCVFLLQVNAIAAEEFQYYDSLGSLPQPRPRSAALIPVVLGMLVWLASLWDTRQRLRLERSADESVVRPFSGPDSNAV